MCKLFVITLIRVAGMGSAEKKPRGCFNSRGAENTQAGSPNNGDVEVSLKTLSDLPYVIGLVRQSLEQQLGNRADSSVCVVPKLSDRGTVISGQCAGASL